MNEQYEKLKQFVNQDRRCETCRCCHKLTKFIGMCGRYRSPKFFSEVDYDYVCDYWEGVHDDRRGKSDS